MGTEQEADGEGEGAQFWLLLAIPITSFSPFPALPNHVLCTGRLLPPTYQSDPSGESTMSISPLVLVKDLASIILLALLKLHSKEQITHYACWGSLI